MKPNFKATKSGLEIIDPIERKRYSIETETPVTPTAGNKNHVPYPMDSTAEITTSELLLPENPLIYVRGADGTLYTEVGPGESVSFSKDEYILDISGSLKVYAHIHSAVQISVGKERAMISFKVPTKVTISARSFHRRPAETITTTADPTDIMQIVSMFGSTLKTTSPERSYPTLRGHPPAVKLAGEVSIPKSLNRPQTGVKIEVPPTLRHVFVVTPLSFYLGAKVIEGTTPRLVTETGYSHSLNGRYRFETTVERVLKQIFFFDCIVQTEGETPSSLYERQAVEPVLEFDTEELYDQSMVEQIETYLEVPLERVEPHLPAWYSKTRLKPTRNHVEFLPFIANDLASVQVINDMDDSTVSDQGPPQMAEDLTQTTNSEITDSETSSATIDSIPPRFSPVIQQYWETDESTDIVSTKPLSASQNSITQTPRDGPLTIEVVCNDLSMTDELVTVYGTYTDSDIPFNVNVHHGLSKQNLREVFLKESDFLHYIGHIDSEGFRCSDGTLDTADLTSIGTKTFFLNACRSYKQGLDLIKAGSIGGIVTLTEVQNQTAVEAGITVARLLNGGLPLYAALTLLQQTIGGNQNYHILGDETVIVTQIERSPPISVEVIRNQSGYEVKVRLYKSSRMKPGSIYTPYISAADSYYLVPGEMSFQHVSKADLIEFLNKEKLPVILEGELRWSTEIKTSEL